MKGLWMFSTILTGAAASARGQSPAVTHVDAANVSAALASGGTLVTAANLSVAGTHRIGTGQVEVHDKETDIFYIVDGEATIVTGGTMAGGRQTAPGQSRGTEVQGGETATPKR